MIAEPLSDYFGVGCRFMFLREARPKMPIEGKGWIINVVTLFIKDIEKFQFNITKHTLSELISFQKELKKKRKGYKLTQKDVDKLHGIMFEIEKTWVAESQAVWTLAFRGKRFHLNTLLQKIHELFAKNTFQKFNKIAQYDFSEAGKCIAMERPTAAAFHLLRGTESTLKDLYFKTIKKNRIKNPMWFDMVDQMRKKKRNKPNEALLDQLDSIRRHFRNPTQHPEKIYSMDEAQDLLASSISVLNMMVKEIEKIDT